MLDRAAPRAAARRRVRGDPLLRITPAAPPERVEGYLQPSVEGVVAAWRALDGCAGAATSEQVGALSRERWNACRSGGTVGLDLYRGGAHIWPLGTPTTPSGASELWTFFRSSTAHA